MSFTVEKIDARHPWSEHPYVQWCIRKPNGFSVDTRNGNVRRFDSETAALEACRKLNGKTAK